MQNLNIYEITMRLPGSMCDKNGKLKLSSTIERFVDITGEQTDMWEEKCNFPERNTSWIINKYDIKIYSYPRKGDIVKLTTYQSRYTRHFCERVYAVYDENDNLLVRMISFWSVRDYVQMKIVSVPEEYKQFTFEEGISGKTDKKMAKNTEYTHSKDIHIRTDDFDTNRHVNNAKYFSFLYECDEVMDYDKYEIDEILLTFSGGINHKDGNVMYFRKDEEEMVKLSQKIMCADETTACTVESYWREV